jgi:hypothetical protein
LEKRECTQGESDRLDERECSRGFYDLGVVEEEETKRVELGTELELMPVDI